MLKNISLFLWNQLSMQRLADFNKLSKGILRFAKIPIWRKEIPLEMKKKKNRLCEANNFWLGWFLLFFESLSIKLHFLEKHQVEKIRRIYYQWTVDSLSYNQICCGTSSSGDMTVFMKKTPVLPKKHKNCFWESYRGQEEFFVAVWVVETTSKFFTFITKH